jgi:hypothetical protein
VDLGAKDAVGCVRDAEPPALPARSGLAHMGKSGTCTVR